MTYIQTKTMPARPYGAAPAPRRVWTWAEVVADAKQAQERIARRDSMGAPQVHGTAEEMQRRRFAILLDKLDELPDGDFTISGILPIWRVEYSTAKDRLRRLISRGYVTIRPGAKGNAKKILAKTDKQRPGTAGDME